MENYTTEETKMLVIALDRQMNLYDRLRKAIKDDETFDLKWKEIVALREKVILAAESSMLDEESAVNTKISLQWGVDHEY